MNIDAILTLAILVVTIALFISDRFRLDVVALFSLLALLLSGVLSPEESLAGFSSPVGVMIAALFVVGGALTDTGVAEWLGHRMGRIAGENESQVILWVMLTTTCVSAFMSSTGTVAILMPVVGTLAHRKGIAPGRIFLPLAFSAHLGSMLTLISTPPNLVVSDTLRAAGHEPFRFFSFFPVGIVILFVGIAYLVLYGRKRLPGEEGAVRTVSRSWTADDLARDYGMEPSLHTLKVPAGSPLCGKKLGDANLRAVHHVNVLGVASSGSVGEETHAVHTRTVFAAGDVLQVQGTDEDVKAMARDWRLEPVADTGSFVLPMEDSLAEVVLPRRSPLVGRTLRETKFRDRFRMTALAVRRSSGEVAAVGPATPALLDFPLRTGDTLLVKGRHKHLRNLKDERSAFILVAEPDRPSERFLEPRRAATAVAITVGMLVVMAFGWLPNVVAVLVAAGAMVMTRCVRPVDVYRTINWESLVLIAAMLPMATALEKTGLTRMLVAWAETSFAGAPPIAVLAAVLLLTSALGLFMSNTATAVLIAPVALRVAEGLNLAPEPLLMGVAIAASAAFATPISSPVNTLVMGPGSYRFGDFTRVGLPLQVLVLVTALLVVPLVFPFR